MARLTDTAIVLRRWEYSETSQTVSALSREYGLVRGLAKGAIRPGGSFSGGFEPVTRGHLGWMVKAGRELAILTEWLLEEVYWPTRHNAEANRAAIYAVDLTARLLTDQDPHPIVFDALDQVLADLSCSSAHLLTFQWTLLEAIGWRPVVEHDVVSGEPLPADGHVFGFRTSAGGIVSVPAEGDWRVRRETIEVLQGCAVGTWGHGADVSRRASGLLAVYIRDLLGEHSEAMRHAFPAIG
ncbi:MAG: DNA repair protein RecO [Phycisphaerae bacterium]|nr:DNA repair protein RecO [Phycisphaerae bacterium]